MLAQYLYQHSRYVVLFILCIFAVGMTSFNGIPRQEDPAITNFLGTITTFYPGASPDRVEALVTKPLEEELQKITEIDEFNSVSSVGVSFINIRLNDDLPKDVLDRLWSEVRDAMNDATLHFPEGVGAPVFRDERLSSFTTIVSLASSDNTEVPLSILNRYALKLADKARNLNGTKLVQIFGEPQEEIRVEVDEQQMLARGLSLRQVASALNAADAKSAAGRASSSESDLLIEIAGKFDSIERIRQVVVNSSDNGSTTTIADLGKVYRSAVTPPNAIAMAEGKRAILVGVTMENARQVDTWSATMVALLDEFKSDLPAGIEAKITYDQSHYAMDRLTAVALNLLLGVALVLLVMLFTLGWRAAVVVAIVLPLCGLLSVTIMDRMGMALEQMSISGLIVSLGLLVDSSIVMTDEVRKRLAMGQSSMTAIRGSVDRLRIPLLASTATTILTFLPMAIITGPAGDFVGSIAVSVIIMLTASTLLALTLTPILAVWLLPKGGIETLHWTSRGISSGAMGRALTHALDWSLKNPMPAIALALVLPLTGFMSFSTLTAQFFPGSDRDQLYMQVKLADGRSIYDTEALVKKLDAKLHNDDQITSVEWSIGENAPAFYYNMYSSRESIPSFAEALVTTTGHRITNELIRRLQREIDQEYPEARVIVRGIDQGPPVFAPLEVEILGPDLAVLQSLGESLRLRLEQIPYVTHTSADLIGGAPKLVMELDEEKLRLAQLQLADASQTLNDGLRGVTGGEVLESTERLPVRVRLGESEWSSADQIINLRIPTQGQAQPNQLNGIALSNLGEFKLLPSQSPVSRANGERQNKVQAFLIRGILPEEALKQLQASLAEDPFVLPAGYHMKFGGDSDERKRVMEKLLAPMGIIFSLMIVTIVMTFNSWRLAGIAGLVCICSIGLSLLALAIFRYPFGITAVIGVIGSIGVSINAAIIILTGLKQDSDVCKGNLLRARDIVMDSSRHIISTTITTFGGFLPLILGGGGFWPPFAMAIAGGVLLSTVVSFFLVPPIFIASLKLRAMQSSAAPNITQTA